MTRFPHFEPGTRPRSFTMTLPAPTFNELSQLAREAGKTPAAVVQTALDLLKVAGDETLQGHVLAIATREGTLLKQIVIPT